MATNETNGIPRGIEVLVKKASVDAEFKALLMRVRSKAAGEIGLELDASEALMLDAVPEAQLAAIIASTRVDPSKKAAFLGKAAAVMLVALGASQVVGQVFESRAIRAPIDLPATQPASASQPTTKAATSPTTEAVVPLPGPIVWRPIVRVAGLTVRPPEDSPPTLGTMPATYPAVNAGDVEKLVPKLDAEDFKDREAAQKALVDMGAGAVQILQDLQKKNKYSLEVNTRIERVIRALLPPATPAPPREVILQNGVRAR